HPGTPPGQNLGWIPLTDTLARQHQGCEAVAPSPKPRSPETSKPKAPNPRSGFPAGRRPAISSPPPAPPHPLRPTHGHRLSKPTAATGRAEALLVRVRRFCLGVLTAGFWPLPWVPQIGRAHV